MPTEWKCIFGRIFPSFWLKVGREKKEITLEKRRNVSFKLPPDLSPPGSLPLPGVQKPQPPDAAGFLRLPSRCGVGSVLDEADTTPGCWRAQRVIWVPTTRPS